jgi:hypothetical protein
MLRSLLFVLVALAAACSVPVVDEAKAPEQTPFIGIDGKPLITADGMLDNSVLEALTANPAACAKTGGEVRPVCMRGMPMCVVPFPDAGKVCSDSSECMGTCRGDGSAQPEKPAKGVCSRNTDPCGCYQLVEKGVAQYMLCAD